MMLSSRLERLDLLFRVLDAGDGAKDVFGELRLVRVFLQAQNALLDVRHDAQEHEYLGHACPRYALATCDFGLIVDFSGAKL